jgi:GNAT superfamily N-acetyltransferase
VLPAGSVSVEAPTGAAVDRLLTAAGWQTGEAWTPLQRDLRDHVVDPGVRIEAVGPEGAAVLAAVLRASFEKSTFTAARWEAMAAGLPYADARCLVAYDDNDNAAATAIVWSAGPGRPGLIEPMGVHPGHRGHGHGKAISLAAASALQELGCSSAMVCTPTANLGGVATYESAGFRPLPQRLDRHRAA